MNNNTKQFNENSEVSPEQLLRLRKMQKQIAWEERREANKPKSVRDEERARELGGLVMALLSKQFLLGIVLPFVVFFGFLLPYVFNLW